MKRRNITVEGYYRPSSSEDSDIEVRNGRNHGQIVNGPWVGVFRLKYDSYCQYFYVLSRDKNMWFPIIQRECEVGTVIHSD